ncbi:NTP transferase domain-containing protein [Haloterrigena sp. SYSU A558-1]|uniref:NTP transferase domain-containing protein n=1 Tax=Haloterrigena gelatinilytica TaxID=2741724 RepID=A0A8J8KDI4_9EURY|nr:NTP transferase domain-containing protein [Haloterrigena gelatinilytica]NUB90208.1 NTP transferase domain-containing protein [Haloterrigena gelatinilytica]NUC73971.1 NTP transferase domain-containing protein [Haloterrigena gelatinilytica]
MRGVILAAGRGRRMRPYTDDVPKAFLEFDGRTLYDRQRDLLEPYADGTSVVLGYRHETVLERYEPVDPIVLEGWDRYENAASLLLALERIDDDLLVINGDVLVDEREVGRLAGAFDALDGRLNLVGCIPGLQSAETAIRWDETGRVSAYGLIEGHQHAGFGVVSREHRTAAMRILRERLRDWYPCVYPRTPTRPLLIPAERHVELNRPTDLGRLRAWLASDRIRCA